MNRGLFLAVAVSAAGLLGFQQDGDTKKQFLKDNALVGPWVYDDFNAGTALAKKTGKPMLVVFR
jgi:hypothetical protein